MDLDLDLKNDEESSERKEEMQDARCEGRELEMRKGIC